MRTFALVFLSALTALADGPIGPTIDNRMMDAERRKWAIAKQQAEIRARNEEWQRQRTAEERAILAEWAKEWRAVEGSTNHLAEEGWYSFTGKVLESHPDGLRVEASFSSQIPGTFWVANYPSLVADGTYISGRVKSVGLYRYTSVVGGSVTVKKYDYGRPCGPRFQLLPNSRT